MDARTLNDVGEAIGKMAERFDAMVKRRADSSASRARKRQAAASETDPDADDKKRAKRLGLTQHEYDELAGEHHALVMKWVEHRVPGTPYPRIGDKTLRAPPAPRRR